MPHIHDAVAKLTIQRGGRTWAFSVPFKPTYWVVTSPKNLEYVLKSNARNYVKGKTFKDNLGEILGRGIFAVDGQEWYWQRKLATHIFSVRSFKAYTTEVFSQKLDLLVAGLAKEAIHSNVGRKDATHMTLGPSASSAATTAVPPSPGVVDLHDLMYRFTLDTFCRIGFGVDPGCLTTEEKIPFAEAFDRAQVISNIRFWIPFWRITQVINGDAFRLQHDVRVIRAFAREIIHQRKDAIDNQKRQQKQQEEDEGSMEEQQKRSQEQQQTYSRHTSHELKSSSICAGETGPSSAAAFGAGGDADEALGGSDLLSLFMAATTSDGCPLNEEQLVDTVINFIIAGRDTTAQALSWTFYLLLLHPEVEAKVLQEIEQLLGQQTTAVGTAGAAAEARGGVDPVTEIEPAGTEAAGARSEGCTAGQLSAVPKPSYDQLRQLKYTRAVFLEGLRLYPSVPSNCKFAVEADVLPDGTAIPAGGLVMYPSYTINRLPSFWGEDADKFRPERWLEMSSSPTPYNYMSFNAGPRVCLGKSLAELEGVYVLVGLLQRFRFSLMDPDQPVEYNLSATLPMKPPGLRVRVDSR